MTKYDLICLIMKKATLHQRKAEQIVHLIFDSMTEALVRDDRIEIRGFGSFANRSYEGYQGRNPKTGEQVTVLPKKIPFFKVGKELKLALEELGREDPSG